MDRFVTKSERRASDADSLDEFVAKAGSVELDEGVIVMAVIEEKNFARKTWKLGPERDEFSLSQATGNVRQESDLDAVVGCDLSGNFRLLSIEKFSLDQFNIPAVARNEESLRINIRTQRKKLTKLFRSGWSVRKFLGELFEFVSSLLDFIVRNFHGAVETLLPGEENLHSLPQNLHTTCSTVLDEFLGLSDGLELGQGTLRKRARLAFPKDEKTGLVRLGILRKKTLQVALLRFQRKCMNVAHFARRNLRKRHFGKIAMQNLT
jgi:hypothetical protein